MREAVEDGPRARARREGEAHVTRSVAVVLASGAGERSGLGRPKQLAKLAGRPVVAHVLERFQAHPGIDEITVVTNELCLAEIEALVSREQVGKVKRVILGGRERYESSLAAIRAHAADAASGDLDLIFHDAVRPLVSERIIGDVLAALRFYDAVDVAIPASDTIVQVDEVTNTIASIPDRKLLRMGQTPQGFKHRLIERAYARAMRDPDFRTTDDCGVVVRYCPETPVFIVDGAPSNVKLTYPDDLMLIDKLMQTNAARRLDATPETTVLSRLRGRTVAIVGGTSGIGAAMARMAGAYGANVRAGGTSTGLDIADAASIEAFLADAAGPAGRIDAVVNAAAVLNRQPLANMGAAEIEQDIRVNILGAAMLAKHSFPYLKHGRGHLLFFASSSYTYGRAFYSTYSASKAAVVNLTQALADEWTEIGVRVNCVNPERTNTPMRVRAFGREPPDTLLDPDEVARKALGVLVGDATGFVYDIVQQGARPRTATVEGVAEASRHPLFGIGGG